MDSILPKDDSKYVWTNHAKDKLVYYRLSPSLIKRVIRFPERVEEGIAPGTIAAMRRNDRLRTVRGKKKKVPEEIWVMYQEISTKSEARNPKLAAIRFTLSAKKRIISAWRYPGVSPKGKAIPIPDEILQELGSVIDSKK